MVTDIKIRDVIDRHFGSQDCGYAEDYILFRTIEDWCTANIDRAKWQFDYSSTICVCGVDLPGRIIFWLKKDKTAFRLRFGG